MYKTSFTSIYEAVQFWKAQGLDLLPIPQVNGHPAKGPRTPGWQVAAAEGHSLEDFNPSDAVGCLLGGSKHVGDVDADSTIAIRLANEVLREEFDETTQFGHGNEEPSHTLYFGDEPIISEEVIDPEDGEMIIELRSLKKDGTRGKQTVLPPSRHYDPQTGAEEIRQIKSKTTAIATVSSKKLINVFRGIGAASLLAKHFPISSNRHNSILALAGVFARANKSEGAASAFILLAYRYSAGYNRDADKIRADIRGVYKEMSASANAHLYGYPTLVEIIPKSVVDKVLELLGIEKQEMAYPLTDSGNGDWLVNTYRDQILFCNDARVWFFYDDARGLWVEGEISIRELAKKRGQTLRQQAERMKKSESTGNTILDRDAEKRFTDQQKAILTAANRAENAEGIRGMLFAASSDPRIMCSRSDFDQHDNLLNVANGVLNLYTGELLAHDPKYLFTKRCPTEYDANATHNVWDETLAAITRNHPDLAPFLQILAGYSTQGNKTEERIFSLQGHAETGKGTFERAITSTLGEDCVRTVAPETVLKQARSSGAASSDISRLEGARWVIVSELEKGNRLQESLLKAMSGNDTVVARGLFKEERQFRPTWQFWFQTNHRLGFDSTDSGNKRRFIEIPFDNVLAKDPLVKFDRNLKSWMRTDKDFHKAVLAWIVKGCIRWRKEGLHIPDSVRKATDALFASNDFLRDFITERCVVDKNAKVLISEMTAEYINYCLEESEEPARGRTFNHMLEERGYVRKQATVRGKGGKAWHGIRLKTVEEMQPQVVPKKPMGTATLDACFSEDEDVA